MMQHTHAIIAKQLAAWDRYYRCKVSLYRLGNQAGRLAAIEHLARYGGIQWARGLVFAALQWDGMKLEIIESQFALDAFGSPVIRFYGRKRRKHTARYIDWNALASMN